MEPLNNAMGIALGEFSPTKAYKIPSSMESIKPLYVPHIDNDLPQTYKQAISHLWHDR